MKQHPCITQRRVLRTALFAATLAILTFSGSALAASVTQSGEQKNMRRVGHTDLQGRPAYQPNVIQYPDGRFIAFAGTHNNIPVPRPGFTFLPNPLNGNTDEPNGTMIIDVTNPSNPKEMSHIPVPVAGGQAQMARMCLGSDLPQGTTGKVYLMRNIQGNTAQMSGYEVWDVTDVKKPVLASALRGIRSTHKLWWECNTGIAYMPGSKDVTSGVPLWRQAQSMVIVDWRNPLRCRQSTSARSVCRWATRRDRASAPPRSMVRSPRMSIPMRPTSWPVVPRRTTSSGTASTRRGASGTMA